MMPARYPTLLWGYSLAVLLVVATAGCVAIRGDQRRQFAGGTIFLPQGYSLREDRNWDTPVATGVLENRRTNIHIVYKERKLYISFPDGGPTDFVATIGSETDVEEIQRVVGTFEPKASIRGN